MVGTSSPDEQPAINALADATGFGYVRVPGPDGKMTQFAHASAIELVTPDGKLSQYYLGVEYSPKDLRLGLVEASEHKIGSPVDKILTYCYHYDPNAEQAQPGGCPGRPAGLPADARLPGWLHDCDVPA